jgi:hypothetical protein
VAGGSPFRVHRPHPLKEQGSVVGKHYSTIHQPQQNQKHKVKVKIKVKVKVKTITGTEAADSAG